LDGAGVDIQNEETLMSGERDDRGRRQELFEIIESRQLGGIQRREHVREPRSCELGQGLGDVRVILDETPVHSTHAQEALELRLVARGKRLLQAFDVLVLYQQFAWMDDMPQALDCLLEQVTLGGLEQYTGLLQQE